MTCEYSEHQWQLLKMFFCHIMWENLLWSPWYRANRHPMKALNLLVSIRCSCTRCFKWKGKWMFRLLIHHFVCTYCNDELSFHKSTRSLKYKAKHIFADVSKNASTEAGWSHICWKQSVARESHAFLHSNTTYVNICIHWLINAHYCD